MSKTCYWPNNGGIAGSHTPCYSGTGESFCCDSKHYCFDNGLCLDISEMTTYRGSCTDRTWGASTCPKYCYENYIGVSSVWVCDNENHFACSPADCQNSSSLFAVPSGKILRTDAVEQAFDISDSNNTSGVASASTVDQKCPSRSGTIAGLGAGLGAALLIALAAIGVLLFLLRDARRRLSLQTYPSQLAAGPTSTESKLQSPMSSQSQQAINTPAYYSASQIHQRGVIAPHSVARVGGASELATAPFYSNETTARAPELRIRSSAELPPEGSLHERRELPAS